MMNGRPTRFLQMLRVFEWRSAMSMCGWTLAVFSGFVGPGLDPEETILRQHRGSHAQILM